jgi:predicted flap endonuclease-1-like 5' DNA nuclease
MANRKIEDVEGIGPATGDKLRAAGIKDTDTLLAQCTTPKQRKDLAEKTGLGEGQVLRFANMVDLYRVNGIGAEYAELLEVAGVNTVPELSRRNAANLTAALVDVNEQKKLTRRTPSETEVTKWVEQAKTLPRVLEY